MRLSSGAVDFTSLSAGGRIKTRMRGALVTLNSLEEVNKAIKALSAVYCPLSSVLYHTRTVGVYGPLVLAHVEGLRWL